TSRREVLPHHPIGHDPRISGLEVDNPDELAMYSVACPLPAGGATIHHSRTLHFTAPNHSNAPRRAYILIFGTPPKPRAVGRDFYWQTQQKTEWRARRAAADAKTTT